MRREMAHRGLKVKTNYTEYPNVTGTVVSVGYDWVLVRDENGKEDRHKILCVEPA